ncbi:MAG TPA: hypothetical protein VKP66_02775 [Steroidobacteraceae bacterium]|nr:hypothetical protein [Steroidobacteraceae bacterium]
MTSAWESLHFAILELVRSTPIKQRLIAAYRLHLKSLPEDQLPEEARETFGQVVQSLHGVAPQRGEDAVAASVRKMSIQQADDCAAHIVEVFGVTCRELLNAARVSAEVVKLHGLHGADREHPPERNTAELEASALIARI